MQYIVIEKFHEGKAKTLYQRFEEKGRMLLRLREACATAKALANAVGGAMAGWREIYR